MRIYLFLLGVCFLIQNSEGICTFPTNLTGAWISSNKGLLEFTSSSISGYSVSTFGALTFNCTDSFATKLLLKSESFSYLGLQWQAFICLDIVQVSQDIFTYNLESVEEPDAQNERVKIYITSVNPNIVAVCDRTTTVGTYDILVRNGSLSSAKVSCSSNLQAYWSYTIDAGNGTKCSSNSSLDMCTDTATLSFDYDRCPTKIAYSENGSLYCIHEVTSGSSTYVTLLNNDITTDETNTYRVTCMVYEISGNVVYMTQYPQSCLSNQTSQIVTFPGASLVLSNKQSCPVVTQPPTPQTTPVVTTYDYSWVYVVVTILVIIAIILVIILCCKVYKKHKTSKDELRGVKIEKESLAEEIDGVLPESDVPPDVLPYLEKEHSIPTDPENREDSIKLTISSPIPPYRDAETPGPHSIDLPGSVTGYYTIGGVRHPSSPLPAKKTVSTPRTPRGGIIPRVNNKISSDKYSPRTPRGITLRGGNITPRGVSVKPMDSKTLPKKAITIGPATSDLAKGRRLPPIVESVVAANKFKRTASTKSGHKGTASQSNKKSGHKVKNKYFDRVDSAKSTTSKESLDSASGTRPKSRSVSFRQDVEAKKKAKRLKSMSSVNQSLDDEEPGLPPNISQVKITRVEIPALSQRMSDSEMKIQDVEPYTSNHNKQSVWSTNQQEETEEPTAGIKIRRVWLEPDDPTDEIWARVSSLWRLGQTWTEKTVNL